MHFKDSNPTKHSVKKMHFEISNPTGHREEDALWRFKPDQILLDKCVLRDSNPTKHGLANASIREFFTFQYQLWDTPGNVEFLFFCGLYRGSLSDGPFTQMDFFYPSYLLFQQASHFTLYPIYIKFPFHFSNLL